MSAKSLAVIKLGGHAMDDEKLLASFLEDLKLLLKNDWQFVIVHGGGPHINALLKALNITSEFQDGLRVTTAPTLAAVEMALCGQVNKDITRRMLAAGIDAAGISGQDAQLLQAEIKKPALGLVGQITAVNKRVLQVLLTAQITPVVAPLALNKAFQPLNVNADTAAGAIAGSLQAQYFVLISDVPGVLNGQKELLSSLNSTTIAALLNDGTISGGMIPKVECCTGALQAGCQKALILNGKEDHALVRYLIHGEKLGTEILAN